MEVNDTLIERLSQLSKLEFSGPAKEAIKTDLQRMLAFVESIQAVDTEGVEPLIHLTPSTNRLRSDSPVEGVTQQDALKNAPKHDTDYIRVPKVLDK